jgi:DNA polymerase-3 subunit beta
MKVTVQRVPFLKSLEIAASIVASKPQSEVLRYVKFTFVGTHFTLEATDNELSIVCNVADAVQTVWANGKALLLPSKVIPILKDCGGESVDIEVDSQLRITTQSGGFTLSMPNPDEFPSVKIDAAEGAAGVPGVALADAIRQTIYATDLTSTRYQLGGVLFDIGERLTCVATDGRRLAVSSCQIAGEVAAVSGIVPIRPLQAVSRIIAAEGCGVDVMIDNRSAVFVCGDISLQTRLVEGRYPDWRKVVPSTDGASTLRCDAEKFLSVVRQAAIVNDQDSRGIDLVISSGELTATAKTAEVGASSVVMGCEADAPAKLTVDHTYLADFLRSLGKEQTVEVRYKQSGDPVVLTSGDVLGVIMPMARV